LAALNNIATQGRIHPVNAAKTPRPNTTANSGATTRLAANDTGANCPKAWAISGPVPNCAANEAHKGLTI